MANTIQKKTKVFQYAVGTTPGYPIGFAAITMAGGGWTTAFAGNDVLYTNVSGDAINELLLGTTYLDPDPQVNTGSTVSRPVPTEPMFGYIFDAASGLGATVKRVLSPTSFIASIDISGGSGTTDNIIAVSAVIDCPTKIVFQPINASAGLVVLTANGESAEYTLLEDPLVFDAGDGTLLPISFFAANNGEVVVQITY